MRAFWNGIGPDGPRKNPRLTAVGIRNGCARSPFGPGFFTHLDTWQPTGKIVRLSHSNHRHAKNPGRRQPRGVDVARAKKNGGALVCFLSSRPHRAHIITRSTAQARNCRRCAPCSILIQNTSDGAEGGNGTNSASAIRWRPSTFTPSALPACLQAGQAWPD